MEVSVRIMVHPLHLFTLFQRNPEMIEWAFKRFLDVAKESVVMYMPINSLDHEYLDPRNKELYNTYEWFFRDNAKLHLNYPTCDYWIFPFEMDELLLSLPKGEKIVFCGGYVENCLPRTVGAFKREYGTLCKEMDFAIEIDETMSYCASATYTKEQLFLHTRTGDGEKHSRNEFEWWERSGSYSVPKSAYRQALA